MEIRVVNATGQTCNKFWIFANLIADAYENNFQIWVLAPDMTLRDYPTLINNDIIKFPLYSEHLSKYFDYKKLVNFTDRLVSNKISNAILGSIYNFLSNFSYRKLDAGDVKSPFKKKYFNDIKRLFTPAKNITDECEDFFRKNFKEVDIVVGVHIRYGDYRTFEGGKYFYNLDIYNTKMIEIENAFPEKRIGFFVASNEHIDLSFFRDRKVFTLPNSNATKDLYCLRLCNYLIGAPSTFSAWASYLASTEIYFIEDVNNVVNKSSFASIEQLWNE